MPLLFIIFSLSSAPILSASGRAAASGTQVPQRRASGGQHNRQSHLVRPLHPDPTVHRRRLPVQSSAPGGPPPVPAASWWKTTEKYKKAAPRTSWSGRQVLHEAYTLGKSLGNQHLVALAGKVNALKAINVVLTG
ncbi:hypothetical protein GBA52_026686 [Prunus armeniaca]|nr:hypothetical protein GBA52_026686 [Prunus armeniaca]